MRDDSAAGRSRQNGLAVGAPSPAPHPAEADAVASPPASFTSGPPAAGSGCSPAPREGLFPAAVPPPDARVEQLGGGIGLYTTPRHPVTTDSLLLAAFCPLRPAWRVCDLGCGGGLLLLALAARGHTGPAAGVDLDPEAVSLLAAGARLNALPSITALKADVRDFKTPRPFDLALANPPYYAEGAGALPAQPQRAAARHAQNGTPADFCAAAARILKDRGRFCLCWPAAGLAGLFAALAAAGLQPKRLQLVRGAPQSAPWLALCEARKGGGEGLEILPDLVR